MRRTVEGILLVHVSPPSSLLFLTHLSSLLELLRGCSLARRELGTDSTCTLIGQDHGHPHVLMLQIANAFFKLSVLNNMSKNTIFNLD